MWRIGRLSLYSFKKYFRVFEIKDWLFGLLSRYTYLSLRFKEKRVYKNNEGYKKRRNGHLNEWSKNPLYEKARVVQVFIGKADFFYCHRYAESEQAILDKLSSMGADEFCITIAKKKNQLLM